MDITYVSLYKNNGIEKKNNIPCDTCFNTNNCDYSKCKDLYTFAKETNNLPSSKSK